MSSKDFTKLQRLKNFVLSSTESESFSSAVTHRFQELVSRQVQRHFKYDNFLRTVEVEEDVWSAIQNLVRKFDGLEGTRLTDVESSDSGSNAGPVVEDLTTPDEEVQQVTILKKWKLKPSGKRNKPVETEPVPKTETPEPNCLRNLCESNKNISVSDDLQNEGHSTQARPEAPANKETGPGVLNHALLFEYLRNHMSPLENRSEFIRELEYGLLLYMSELMDGLISVSKGPRSLDDVTMPVTEKRGGTPEMSLVLVTDVVDRFANASARERKLQDFYDTKIKGNRERDEAANREKSLQATITGQPKEPEKPKSKAFNEDHEIMSILSKMKQLKVKENEKVQATGNSANEAIEKLMDEDNKKKKKKLDGLLERRAEMDFRSQVKSEIVTVARKHLLFFLQNDPYFRKSKFLLQAYLKQ